MNQQDYSRAVPGLLAPVIVVKSADETVNNSATLQDDDELKFYVEPYSTWRWSMEVNYLSGTTPDFKPAIILPTGATPTTFPAIVRVGAATASVFYVYGASVGLDGGGATDMMFSAWGIVIVGATGGFVKLQWAQNTADASDTKVLKGSTLMAFNVTPYAVKP